MRRFDSAERVAVQLPRAHRRKLPKSERSRARSGRLQRRVGGTRKQCLVLGTVLLDPITSFLSSVEDAKIGIALLIRQHVAKQATEHHLPPWRDDREADTVDP